MIEMRRRQLSFGDGLIDEEVSDLREAWADDGIVAAGRPLRGAIGRDYATIGVRWQPI